MNATVFAYMALRRCGVGAVAARNALAGALALAGVA